MNCLRCGNPLPAGSRRDRVYCSNSCSARASDYRRKNGIEVPPRWQHPALTSDDPLLRAAAERARQLGEANGWSPVDHPVRDRRPGRAARRPPGGERVTLTEIRALTPRHTSAPRVAEILAGLGLLDDDTVPAVRAWVDRRTGELPPGFAATVRDWLLVLLDGDARSRPRSATTIYVYCTAVEPLIGRWSARPRPSPGGHRRRHPGGTGGTSRVPALHHDLGGPVAVPVRQEAREGIRQPRPAAERCRAGALVLPMTDGEIRAVEQAITLPGQRMVVALAAVHAARWEAIRRSPWTTWTCPTGASPSRATPSGSATSVTRHCGPGLTTAARPGRTPPTGTS